MAGRQQTTLFSTKISHGWHQQSNFLKIKNALQNISAKFFVSEVFFN
jgi:hypothetical protein